MVDRPRLLKKLDDCLHPSCRLALIAAPAGFGKTTLLSAWVTSRMQPASWLTLDEGDNDPSRFFTYLVAAAEKIEANTGGGIIGALQSPQQPALEEWFPSLVLLFDAIPRQFVLLLDDYHLISSPKIHKAITFLIEHQPPQMHLVIATRKDPPLPIPLLRSRRQLVELRQTDLRFTGEEAARFLEMETEVALSDEDIASLTTRTEGWVAGLQMAALSLKDKEDAPRLISNFSGGHEYIMDYFASEVLAKQPEPSTTFLLQSSILDRLCGPLCEAVTGQTSGQHTLEQLQQANLFIVPMDNQRTWYRYHHLFRDLLRKQLQQEASQIIPELHRRASSWFEENRLIEEAIDHALGAEDYRRSANLIRQSLTESYWKRGETITVLRWLDALPDQWLSSYPDLCAYHAMTLFLTGELDKAEARLRCAESFLNEQRTPDSDGETSQRRRNEQTGMVSAVRAYIAYFQGDGPAIIHYARQALDLLPEENTIWRNSAAINLGDAYSVSGDLEAAGRAYSEALEASRSAGNLFLGLLAGTKLAVAYKHQGHLHRVEELCQQLVRFANSGEQPHTEMAGKVYAIWGDILCEWNELERAEAILRKAVDLCKREGNVAAIGVSHLYLLRVLLARGNRQAMEDTLRYLEELAQATSVPVWIHKSIVAWKSWVWINEGQLEVAAGYLSQHGIRADNDLGFRGEGEYLSLARLQIAQGHPAEADELMRMLYSDADAHGQLGLMIACLCIRAVANKTLGLREEALIHLDKALSLAEPEGFIQVFIEEGPLMAQLVYEMAEKKADRQYLGRLLAAFANLAPPARQQPRKNDDIIEPLSQRELQVLRLIADGLSNQEIAARLYLSVRTIKFHAGNIFSKLGVKSRTEAVARARVLGLLSP
jgi:LuxR family transcriptional regulator, maltose regulon positive regulatory protein